MAEPNAEYERREDTPGVCVECHRPAGDWGTIAGRPYCQECGEDFLAEAGYGAQDDSSGVEE